MEGTSKGRHEVLAFCPARIKKGSGQVTKVLTLAAGDAPLTASAWGLLLGWATGGLDAPALCSHWPGGAQARQRTPCSPTCGAGTSLTCTPAVCVEVPSRDSPHTRLSTATCCK